MKVRVRNRHSLLKCAPVIMVTNLIILIGYCYYKDVYIGNYRYTTSLLFFSANSADSSQRYNGVAHRSGVNWTKCAEDCPTDLSKSNNTSPTFWVFPTLTSAKLPSIWRSPRNWTTFVPRELGRTLSCENSCHSEDPDDFTPIWNILSKAVPGIQTDNANTLLRTLASLLFAIKNGAKGILLTSDLGSLPKSVARLTHDSEQLNGVTGLEYFGIGMTTDSYHYHHRFKNEWDLPCQYRIRKRMNPVVTTVVRCRSFSVQSNYEDSQNIKTTTTTASTLTDFQSPPIFTSRTKFNIDNFLDVYFDRKGMWAAFVSLFESAESVNAWGFWVQRLLQETHGEMAITSLPCPLERKTKYLKTLEPDERSLRIHKIVTRWQCEESESFYQCAKSLANEMKTNGFVSQNDVTLLDLWIEGLKNYAKYLEPRRINETDFEKDAFQFCVFHSPVFVSTPKQNSSTSIRLFPHIHDKCKTIPHESNNLNPFTKYEITKPLVLKDIALVIIFFNSTIFGNIPYLQDLYTKHFSTIIYCGPFEKEFREFQRKFHISLSFVSVAPTRGFSAYECVTRAMMLNYDVSGYLEIADDVLLNTWNLRHVPRDKFWWQKVVFVADSKINKTTDHAKPGHPGWWPWGGNDGKIGYRAVQNSWIDLRRIEKRDNGHKTQEVISSFMKKLKENTGLKEGVVFSTADIFYVPSKYREVWGMLAEIFLKNNLFLEIAVPTLIYGLEKPENIFRFEGNYLWGPERRRYREFYNKSHHFLHPWKLSSLSNVEDARFLCTRVLPEIVRDLIR